MKYYLVKILTNAQGQDGTTIAKFDTQESAIIGYHNTLASFHNAADVLYAVVEILDEYGRVLGGKNGYTETVDHRPTPEPQPEPEET